MFISDFGELGHEGQIYKRDKPCKLVDARFVHSPAAVCKHVCPFMSQLLSDQASSSDIFS